MGSALSALHVMCNTYRKTPHELYGVLMLKLRTNSIMLAVVYDHQQHSFREYYYDAYARILH